MKTRYLIDWASRNLIFVLALASFAVLVDIAVFMVKEALPALQKIGLLDFLFGTEWRPTNGQFGIGSRSPRPFDRSRGFFSQRLMRPRYNERIDSPLVAMNLQQLRYICEVARQDLNLSRAAEALHTSQPGVSRQVLQLEDEVGVKIFQRAGKRIVGVTEPGREILRIAQRILAETRNLKDVGTEFTREASGALTIATTHTQARYALPPVIRRFMKRYPQVRLSIHQGSPTQIAELTIGGHRPTWPSPPRRSRCTTNW